jgi:AcrR family transcriptional regulator
MPVEDAPRELRARGKRTRARLLEAGVEVFARRGYHSARVDDIVKLAKTSHGTFYLYFANKEELFRALAADVAAELKALAEALPPVTPDDEGRAALHGWLERFADAYALYGPVIRAWTEAEIGKSDFGRMGTDVHAEFTRALLDRIRVACPPDIDPTIAAVALVAMIERSNYYVLSGQVAVGRAAMVDTLAAVMYSALYGAPLPSRT